jgi:hypothetical protein
MGLVGRWPIGRIEVDSRPLPFPISRGADCATIINMLRRHLTFCSAFLAALLGAGWHKSFENRRDRRRQSAWRQKIERLRAECGLTCSLDQNPLCSAQRRAVDREGAEGVEQCA